MRARAVFLLGALLGCDPLLGGRCSDGWTPSPGACDAGAAVVDVTPPADVPVVTDVGAAMDAGVAVDVIVATDAADAGVVSDGGSTVDAAADGSGRDVVASDTGCTPPETVCGGACVDTASSREHCGGCGRACPAGQVCASGVCSASCAPPLLLCGGVCIDPQTDPDHCGGCGVVCSTGICNGGRCRDARAGHLVLIGHDYENTRPDQNRVLGNSVFLSASSAPRVATYAVGARASGVSNAGDAIRQVAGLRTWTERTVASAEALAAAFSVDATDVVLIHHLADASDESVAALARRVAGPAVGFVRAGGVVVVLDGVGTNRGTWPIAEATGLLPATGHVVVTGGAAEVVSGADAVAIGLPVAYRAEQGSVALTGTDGTGVVIAAAAGPVVIHRVVFGR